MAMTGLPMKSKTTAEAVPAEDRKGWWWTQIRRMMVLIAGSAVFLAGVALLVLPGPGWVTIFLGLAILATEFAWARWMLKHAKRQAAKLADLAKQQLGKASGNGDKNPASPSPDGE